MESSPCIYEIKPLQVRTRLDVVEPQELRKTFKTSFAKLQRNNQLKQFQYINDTYLLANNGTGFFSFRQFEHIKLWLIFTII